MTKLLFILALMALFVPASHACDLDSLPYAAFLGHVQESCATRCGKECQPVDVPDCVFNCPRGCAPHKCGACG
ncbi:MAG: hypothetical protein OXJ90_08865 [Spirochaetaceae bacterium]|nr:hypothetical protein [Spirochaetaceae bacterium]